MVGLELLIPNCINYYYGNWTGATYFIIYLSVMYILRHHNDLFDVATQSYIDYVPVFLKIELKLNSSLAYKGRTV